MRQPNIVYKSQDRWNGQRGGSMLDSNALIFGFIYVQTKAGISASLNSSVAASIKNLWWNECKSIFNLSLLLENAKTEFLYVGLWLHTLCFLPSFLQTVLFINSTQRFCLKQKTKGTKKGKKKIKKSISCFINMIEDRDIR